MFFKNIYCLLLVLLVCANPAVAGPNANATVSLDLIVDGGSGNQMDDGVTSGTVSGQGTKIAVEVFAKGVTTSLMGVQITFDFKAEELKLDKVENSAFLFAIPEATGVIFAATAPVTLPGSGFIGRAEFSTVVDVTGREFTLGIKSVTLAESAASSDVVTTTNKISFNANNTDPSADFDGNGVVGLPDFLLFVDHFGTSRGGASYDAKYDLDGNGTIGVSDFLIFVDSFGKQVPPSGGGGGSSGSPDLVVDSPSVSNSTLTTGQSFTLKATVRNQGNGSSASTTLRYYQSSDVTISTSDTAIGTDSVNGLSASGTSAESISLTAPSSAGTYYYGACVNSVTGESDTGNNCSDAVAVTVGSPDLVVESPSVSDSTLTTGQSFTLRATVRNQGTGSAASTTLRYYRSSNSTISTSDTAIGTDSVSGLSASGTSAESISLNAPSSAGTYYYGACVESVSGESDTNNNCSDGMSVTVSALTPSSELSIAPGETKGYSKTFSANFSFSHQTFERLTYRVQSSTVDDGLSGLSDVKVSWKGSRNIFRTSVNSITFSYNIRVSSTVPSNTTLRATIVYNVGTVLPPTLDPFDSFEVKKTYTLSLMILVRNSGGSSSGGGSSSPDLIVELPAVVAAVAVERPHHLVMRLRDPLRTVRPHMLVSYTIPE